MLPHSTLILLLVCCFLWTASAFLPAGTPKCEEPEVENGYHRPRAPFFTWAHRFGTKITFYCNSNYTLRGNKTAICLLTGRWSATASCEEKKISVGQRSFCPMPEAGEHVKVDSEKDSFQPGDVITFSCDGDLIIRGRKQATCGDDGSFDNTPPKCIVAPNCPPPEIPNGGLNTSNDMYSFGDVVYFQCDEGFELVGEESTICGEDGKFARSNTRCLKFSPPPTCKRPRLSYKMYLLNSKNEYELGETTTFACGYGYELVGNSKVMCLPDGVWSSMPPKCERVYCIRPQNPVNGKIVNEKKVFYRIYQIAKFVCDPGYQMVGEAECECKIGGNFYPEAPTCEKAEEVEKPVFRGSCLGRCNKKTYFRNSCQCDIRCFKRGDCCDDYFSNCYY